MKNRIHIPKVPGIVKWFDDEKGYGFIIYKGIDHFVHYKEIKMKGHRTLQKDQRVMFYPLTSAEGKPIACEVEVHEVVQ